MFNKKCDCLIGIVISIVLGILIGYAFFFGLITGIVTALWMVFGTAILGLILLFTLIIFSKRELDKCVYINGECLGLGIFGTIILSLIALSIPLIIFNVGIAILIGALVVFLGITLISMAKLLCCLINPKYKCRD